MFIPFKVPNFMEKVLSLYKASVILNAGALVDIDPADTSAIPGSVGFTVLSGGSVKLATIAPQSNTGGVGVAVYGKELGMVIPGVTLTGPSLQERILELASSYMTIPVGFAAAVYVPTSGDIVATDQYVGFLSGDSGAPGLINTASTANYAQACGIFQGRFRLVQTTDQVRARYLGNTTANGVSVGLFQFC